MTHVVPPSQLTPLWNNDQFIPDGGFKLRKIAGIQAVKDPYVDGKLLSEKYQLLPKHFYKHLQVKNFSPSGSKEMRRTPELSFTEQTGKQREKGLLSKYDNLILSNSTEHMEIRRPGRHG